MSGVETALDFVRDRETGGRSRILALHALVSMDSHTATQAGRVLVAVHACMLAWLPEWLRACCLAHVPCVRACLHACVHACVRACACVLACVCARVRAPARLRAHVAQILRTGHHSRQSGPSAAAVWPSK